MTLDDLKLDIRTSSAINFCRQSLFNSKAWLFEPAAGLDLAGSYDDFKFHVATEVNTSPNNIAIVGSAKFGFSLHPEKGFRAFQPESDIDIVIVSPELFERTWAQFRLALFRGYEWINKRHASQVIRKYIVLSGKDQYDTTYLRDTAVMVSRMRKRIRETTRLSSSLNYRIYSSWEDVEMYHVYGIEKLQELLVSDDA